MKHEDAANIPRPEKEPDGRLVTRRQAEFLAAESGASIEELVGTPIGSLEQVLKWRLDPALFLFRKVCGRVVRTDPATGTVYGVPNATVHVEDTDCSFLGLFPVEHPWWWWLWPVSCHREEIATTTTDECGRFCVWIPRWDIDRLLRFRLERVCFPDIFRPRVIDILEWLEEPHPGPGPGPDPAPFVHEARELARRAGELLPAGVTGRLLAAAQPKRFGDLTTEIDEVHDLPAFAEGSFPPPLGGQVMERMPEPEGARLDRGELLASRFHGPFLRCPDVIVAEWMTFFDVPDITFRVTQDVDGDGDEETIYGESLFDVRWNAGNIPNVLLEASGIARVSHICEGPHIECVDEPAIRTVGLMPLEPTHIDAAGYSTRVNRPHPAGLSTSAPSACGTAQSPLAGTLQLHGCHHLGGAQHYRLTYQYRATPSDPLTSEIPFTGLEWWAPLILPGGPRHIAPVTPDGWYKIQPAAEMVFPHWLLNWPSGANGQYVVRLYLGDGASPPNPIPGTVSDPVTFTVDNRAPNAGFTSFRWRRVGDPMWSAPLPQVCPIIHRPAGSLIEVQVAWWANAVHLREAVLGASGCGGGNPGRVGPASNFDHWHVAPGDNSFTRTGVFQLVHPSSGQPLPAGCYTFSIDAHTRAFNPAGDGGGPGTNWCTDYAYSHAHPSVAISVVDV